MKVFVALACLAVANANVLLPAATIGTKLVSTGSSQQTRSQDAAGNYMFAYDEQHGDGGSSRKESGSGWGDNQAVKGSYTLNVADGRQRVVKYVADALGFRAAISTNEPGTAAQPAAATSISSPYLPPAPVAPLAIAEPIAAAPLAVASAPLALNAGYGYGNGLALNGAYGNGLALGKGLGYGLAAPVAVAAVPLASSYSTAISHDAPALLKAPLAEPLAYGGLKGGLY